jgi:deoxyribodipyrimidine photo-lyase
MDKLDFRTDDPRLRRLNEKPIHAAGEYVLYWMQAFRRAADNAALAYAIEQANALGVPCLVYEAIRPDYPHASDRMHRFVLEGARETAARLRARGVGYAFFLPRAPAGRPTEARGIVARLAARACLVVSDDFPAFVVPGHNAAAAAKAPCAFVAVDDCAVIPLALLAKPEVAARTIRPKVTRLLGDWLKPIADPAPRHEPLARFDWPFDPVDLAHADLGALAASCAIDHGVPPIDETRGGSAAARQRLDAFVRRRLRVYDSDRNDPARDGTSGLSPYLHFGMISPRAVALEALASGADASTQAFVEQLLVRRALSFNFVRSRVDYSAWAALPAWARATLEAHAKDERYAELTVSDLEEARTPDALWNAAMRELRARGTIQSYARMLWGKLPLLWMRRPEDAHAAMVHLNDKWALDGRDPNGYANVSWCFGLHDRPWPERRVFGQVRTMTSANAQKKLDFGDYIRRWSCG